MKKQLILLYILVVSAFSAYSQLDTIHYLPPLFGRVDVDDHYISVSTISTTNVLVEITKGDGTLIQNTTITAATPSLISLGSGYASIGIIDETDLNTIIADQGIIVKSSEPTFVTIRHIHNYHGLCLTSKGRFSLGTAFRSGHLRSNAVVPDVKAHQISVMATRDNTIITFSDFSQDVIFKNTPVTGTTSNPITITLDKGESYVIAAYLDEVGAIGNENDVNGTKITSNKPIAVNSGSWLSGASSSGRDIGVDQITPLENIGTEYVFSKGDGPASNERPCIVAEYNNTQVFINGNLAPTVTLNAGDYYFLLDSAFSPIGNIYVRTSEPAYLYQSLSGAAATSNGLSFIPPIRCYGNTEVIIPNVDLVGLASIAITARTGANVYINGSTTPLIGAQVVTGNASWVTYDVLGGTGIFSVSSDSVINVALLTLDGARGSAGYFSGFGILQEISRGDSMSFNVCQNTTSSFITMNIDGPYVSITPNFLNSALGGNLVVDLVSGDTIYFTYTNLSSQALIDTVDVEICKISSCSGTILDTICTISNLVFNKLADINAGIGDSIIICQDTSTIDLINVLSGGPPATGIWVDEDQSGFLFNGTFQTNIATPGIYHYTYIVNGPLSCYDSSVVTINVLPYSNSYCCPVNPVFSIQNINCNGASTGYIQISDPSGPQFSIDSGATYQSNGNFTNLSAGVYFISVEFVPGCSFDTIITLTEPSLLGASLLTDSTLCHNSCDGGIFITPSGGTGPYNFMLNGILPQVTPQYLGLCVGNYTVTITDQNNCSINQNIQVNEPLELSLTLNSVTDATCSSQNGIIVLSAQGGTPAYSYSINNGPFQSSPVFSGLASGSYDVVVTDSNNCSDQMTVVVNNVIGQIGSYIDTLFDVTCNSDSTGKVIVGVVGGAGPYQYSLSNGQVQSFNVFDSLAAGNYTLDIIDNIGCYSQVTFLISEPTPLSFSLTGADALCYNSCTGTAFLDVSGSNPPYNYSINNSVYSLTPFTQYDSIVNICAGNNTIAIKDSSNCIISSSINILQPDSIEISTVLIDPSCYNNCDGEILISTIGGAGSFNFSLNGGTTFQPTNQFLNLCDNTYVLSVRDSNLCTMSDTVSLVSPLEFMIDTVGILDATCGNSDGSIEIEINNPINPTYTFTIINTGAVIIDTSTATFLNLSSGVYEIVATDNSGCADTIFVGISDQSLTATVDSSSINQIDCFGLCSGSFSVIASAGNAPYQYSINNGLLGNSFIFGGLCAGNYVVLVQDNSGCIETVQFEMTEPTQLSTVVTKVNIDCFGDCSGELNFTNNFGGIMPYSFSTDNGVSFFLDSSFTNLCEGQYTVIIKDSNSCEVSAVHQLVENPEIVVLKSSQNLTCNNSADGTISFSVSGGSPGYQYSIDDGVTFTGNSNFTGLNAGTYLVQIMDSQNCAYYDTIVLLEPLPIIVSITKVENICSYQCIGEIDISVSGGTQPYQYSIDSGLNLQTTGAFNNLCGGQYQIYVVDHNNCEVMLTDSLLYIDSLGFTSTLTNSNCDVPTGIIDIAAFGGTVNYQYSLDGTTYNVAPLFNNLAAGTYDIYLQDANSCIVQGQAIINNFAAPQIDSVQNALPCHGQCNGSITIFASGGNGLYEFSVDGINFQNNNQFTAICAGNYSVVVRDGNGCLTTLNYILPEPDTISFETAVSPILCFGAQNGIINLTAQGGVGQLGFVFNAGAASSLSNFTQLGPGNYNVQIIDEIGCSVDFDTILTEPPQIQITFNMTNPTCFGDCNGVIEAVVSGGTLNSGSYHYNWSQSTVNSAFLNNACGGLYSIVVQDSNGCIADSINFELTEPVYPTIDSVVVVGNNCFGSPIGSSITAYAPLGNAFSFDGGLNFGVNNQISNIPASSYWVYIQDANGCEGDSVQVQVQGPQQLIGFTGPDAIVCPGEMVNFAAIVTGGTAPFQFNWNNGNNQPSFSENVNNNSIYYFEITDANGCFFASDTQTVEVAVPPILTTSNDTVVCPNQGVYLWAQPVDVTQYYTYMWNGNQVDSNFFITPEIVEDTVFYIVVTDECNLTATDSINANIYTEPVIEILTDSIYGCVPHAQKYLVNISQNTILGAIEWQTAIGYINSSDNNAISIGYSYPGNDQLSANFTSANGCNYNVDFDTYIHISSTPIANFSFLPTIPNNYDEVISFKNESKDYIESNWTIGTQLFSTIDAELVIGTINDIYRPFNACLKVSNDENCSAEICQLITIESDQLIFVPNSFTPGSGGYNSIFKVDGTNVDIYGFHMVIFNRWGEIVFESFDIDSGWDGTYAGNVLETAVFTWKIDVALKSDPKKVNNLVGQVTLLR